MTLLAADDRAYLTVEHPSRYAFGPSAVPSLIFNAVDSSGVMWVCDEPQGWDAAAVATPLDRKQYGHGAYAGEGFFEERILTFSGAFAAPTPAAATAAQSRLRSAIQGDLVNGVAYTHLDEDTPRTMYLLPNGQPHIPFVDDRACTFGFTMVAPDPFKYGPTATYGPARLPSATGNPGRVYPRAYPVHYGALGAVPTGAPIFVPNAGDIAAEAVYTVTGPVPQPIIGFSTGLFVAVALDLAATDTLIVDTAAGTLTVNGVNRLDALRADSSTFPLIPPTTATAAGGVSVQLGSTTGGTDQAAALTVTTAPTWK